VTDEELVALMKGIRPSGRVFPNEVAEIAGVPDDEATTWLDDATQRGQLVRSSSGWWFDDRPEAPKAESWIYTVRSET
jgi:hypothetical protein